MIFLPLLIWGIYLYLKGNRVSSAVIFFFFLSDGFQVVPLSLFNTHLGFDKPVDFCFLYAIILFIFGFFQYENFISKRDPIAIGIFTFLSGIIALMFVNYFCFKVPTKEIIQTSRFFFIVLSYFLFVRLNKGEVQKIHKILFSVVVVQSLIFILQVIISKPILTGYYGGLDMGLPFLRFYNVPVLIYFYVFYALFQNPFQGRMKILSIAILSITLILPMHRGWIVSFLLSIVIASYLRGGLKNIAKYVIIASLAILPVMSIISARFTKDNTEGDISSVLSGNFVDYVQQRDNDFSDGTMIFRIAETYERLQYVEETWKHSLFGIGLMSEGSQYTMKNLDFKIGLIDNDYNIYQVETSDIAWLNFIVRFGIVGTLAFFSFFIILMLYFYKHRKLQDAIPSLMFLLLMLFTSINLSQLYYVWMFSILFLSIASIKNEIADSKEEPLLSPTTNQRLE